MKPAMAILLAAVLFYIPHAEAEPCDYKVEILIDGSEFDSADFKWKMMASRVEGKPTNITGTAEIEGSGKTAKSYKPWTSSPISKQKTSSEYSPNLKPGSYTISAEISTECEDTDSSNNNDGKEIEIRGSEKPQQSSAKKQAASGTSAKSEIETQEEAPQTKATPVTKTAAQPAQSIPKEEASKENTIYAFGNAKSSPNIAASSAVSGSTVYESSSQYAKDAIIYILLGVSILLNIVLIWRR